LLPKRRKPAKLKIRKACKGAYPPLKIGLLIQKTMSSPILKWPRVKRFLKGNGIQGGKDIKG
jgi:hypothetical protein